MIFEKTDRALWYFIWLAFILWTLIAAYAQLNGWQENYFFQNIDYDPVLHILRALEFVQTGNWASDIFPRIDPPGGMMVPWTYPMDALLIAGAWPLQFFMPWREALLIWGMMLSPVLWITLAAALQWAVRPLLKTDIEKIVLLFLTGAAASLGATFYLLRAADHHGTALIFQVLALGTMLRSDARPRQMFYAGMLCCLGFWIAIEGFMLFAITAAALGWLWLTSGYQQLLHHLIRFTTGMLLIAVPIWLIEHFSNPLAIEHDRISILHLTWIMLACLGGVILQHFSGLLINWKSRLGAGAIVAVSIFATLQILFPGFYHGPAQQIDPWLQHVWLSVIGEIRPLPDWAWWNILPWCGLAYFAIEQQLRPLQDNNCKFHLWLALFIGYFVLTVISPRWLRNFEVMYLPFTAMAFVAMASYITQRFLSAQPEWWRPVVMCVVVVTLCFSFVMLPHLIVVPEEKMSAYISDDNCKYGAHRLMQYGNWDELLGEHATTVVTREDLSFGIIFWTRHNSLIANYHRNLSGFRKMQELVTARDDDAAQQVMRKYGFGALLLCPPDQNQKSEESIAHDVLSIEKAKWLDLEHPPAWLEVVAWPADIEELKTVPLNARPVLFKLKP